jgi:regulator of sirC expression with transglutaminase-like and TPR domain
MIVGIEYLGLVEDEDIILDEAALDLAALDVPDVDLSGYIETLEGISNRLAAMEVGATAQARAEALQAVIALEFGFVGDTETYDDPDNANMIRVIDRRRGLPVSLSILYTAAARRQEWVADSLNTPGHLLTRIGADRDFVLIDPFAGGSVVEPRQVAGLLTRWSVRSRQAIAAHMSPMTNRAVLVRLLTNQASRAEQSGAFARALEVFERITTVDPSYTHGWWERARLEAQTGDSAAAKDSLVSLLEVTRDQPERERVLSALHALSATRH